MKQLIDRWLNAIPIRDPLQHRQASMLQLVLLVWMVLAAFGAPAIMIQGATAPRPIDAPPVNPLAILFLMIALVLLFLTPLLSLILLRRAQLRTAVGVAAFGLIFTQTLASIVLGFRDPSILVVFQLPIVLVGLLAGRRMLWVATCLSIVFVATVGFLESLTPPLAGFFLPAADIGNGRNVPTVQVVGFFVVITVLVALLLDRFGSALRDALTSSLKREEELQRIRATLEANVAERTSDLRAALSDMQAQSAEQQRLLAELAEQRTLIQDLSVPVIPMSASTLVMPLVGALDSSRLALLQEQCLRTLERSSARMLVLDITGVPVVDSQVAQGLLATVRSSRLLGAEVALVGIRPEVAQTIVGLGIDLRDVHTFRDLHSALDYVSR